MNLTLVVGARPNFMKISPLINSIERKKMEGININYRLIHTGQHFDKKMSQDFFTQLGIPEPHLNLNCGGSSSNSEQIGCIMIEFEKELIKNKPNIVIVVGDVNSTMSCAIVAKKLKIDVAHIEAGIRSLDRGMPEEINRLVTDSISDYFFTTSKFANDNLKKENIHESKIFFVGNTMIDCLKNNLNKLEKCDLIKTNIVDVKKYFLMTLHRPSNVDDLENLKKILLSIDEFVGDIKVVFPIHPRTQKKLSEIDLKFKNIIITEPQKYLQFIDLIKNSIGVITDSGGITEETTFLNIPCITLRDTTERPETVEYGTNVLVGNDMGKLKNSIKSIILNKWKIGEVPELWDGKTSDRIIENLLEIYK